MPDYFFTFGQDHVLPPTIKPLRDYYVRITAANSSEARERMVEEFGQQWAFQYDEKPQDRFVPAGELVHLKSRRLEELLAFNEVNKAGYAGILKGGMLVDRRAHPDAIPVPENSLMNVAAPRCVPCLGSGAIAVAGANGEAEPSPCEQCNGTGLWIDPNPTN